MVEANSVIKASAGTGKTFALATRFIRLMLIDRCSPESIVALTFSRAAAQEIYTKILSRLCEAAKDDAHAECEWRLLIEDFERGEVPESAAKLAWIRANFTAADHDAAKFRELLRRLVDTQHLGAIATLDSFILRIVRNFPKEMGFQNAVAVLDPIEEDKAVEESVRRLLTRTDETGKSAAKAFVTVRGEDYSRTCLDTISRILVAAGWRNFVMAHPECREWTAESMGAALGLPANCECPDLSGVPINEINRRNTVAPEESFIRKVREYDGHSLPFFIKREGVIGEMARFFWQNPDATEFAYTYYSKPYVLRCGAKGAAALHGAVRSVVSRYLRHQLEIVCAKIRLVLAIEGEYDRSTRRMGKLTFSDFTRYSAENEFSSRGICIRNVEYRFDSRFDHWALDEFQDTSELQWRCLKELVQNAADAGEAGESRSAMVVGDMKQSIYAWRGASRQPFADVASWPAMQAGVRDLSASYRYGPNIAHFVNSVFGEANIAPGDLMPADCARAVEVWREGWREHTSSQPADYVKVVAATDEKKDEKEGEVDIVLEALANEVGGLWARHQGESSRDTVAVLVRSNDDGVRVATCLRSRGLPVVWEGMNRVCDLPVVQAVVALLKLSEHPEDTLAWQTANGLFDVRKTLLPDCKDVASASSAVAKLITQQGLSRTLKDFCTRLVESGGLAPNGLSSERLRQLVQLGVEFEQRDHALGGLDDFFGYLEKAAKREQASSADVIRVLTIHRSKGLGVDHVFVPLFESSRDKSAIDWPKASALLYDGSAWVMSHLPRGCEDFNPNLFRAVRAMRNERLLESLRTYYVALTRSKKSLFVILKDQTGHGDAAKGLLMSDLLVQAVGGKLPFELGELPSLAPKPKKPGSESDEKVPSAQSKWGTPKYPRVRVERVSPSKAWHGQSPVGTQTEYELFGEGGANAIRRGIEFHEWLQSVEWADDETLAKLPPDFREAFVRPSPEATVWRERRYELFADGKWETGQFDRVVFDSTLGQPRATIYDFKTNRRREGESTEDFRRRMDLTYAGQMAAYRRALASLTGLPLASISTRLLLML